MIVDASVFPSLAGVYGIGHAAASGLAQADDLATRTRTRDARSLERLVLK